MIAMAASSFSPPEPISGKIVHVISPHYIRFVDTSLYRRPNKDVHALPYWGLLVYLQYM